ncbi:MAG: methylenetetrahydrofolate reductase [NAD(P)H] [Cytophagales bacterium]|nr:MAG: methylenetetrahydrofolate reductase [NAD(P)H] [Cytophagales bacterium]
MKRRLFFNCLNNYNEKSLFLHPKFKDTHNNTVKIIDLLNQKQPTFSFEFYPPKTYHATVELGMNIGQLMKLSPSFVSVTYGAGGSTQNSSFDLSDFLQNNIGWTTMAHYTCVGANREKITQDLELLYQKNIRNLMLLRGDPPKGSTHFPTNTDGFNHGSDLVAFVNAQKRFSIGAGAYPEGHVEASSLEEDIRHLNTKVKAGADFLVTQMFFDNQYYFDFAEKTKTLGIQCPIVAGIIPIINFKQIQRFAELSGAKIPETIIEQLAPYQHDEKKMYQIGVDIAIAQCKDLLAKGAPGIHFYTLNKSTATVDIFESLN